MKAIKHCLNISVYFYEKKIGCSNSLRIEQPFSELIVRKGRIFDQEDQFQHYKGTFSSLK